MVVIPAGSFLMGSPKDEAGRSSDEDDGKGNQVPVTIARQFAAGKFEVTFAEWEACVAGGGCKSNPIPPDAGWGKGTDKDPQPVINVSWGDTQEFVAWLNQADGLVPPKPYRLLTEAEWEYAARGGPGAEEGGKLPYWWGKDIRRGNFVMANCADCGSQWGNKQAAPVGDFPANPFVLHDMHGNVWEWVEDAWHENYANLPRNGSAWADNVTQRVIRGGSWFDDPRFLRSADRIGGGPDVRNSHIGFRVARTLSP
jgi:formylglycine-generating enzyme required for sulfatase activity